MDAVDRCKTPPVSRRRSFWTTQINACGEYVQCGDDCGIPGLTYIDQDVYITGQMGRTIATNDWLTSLILNILNTKGRVLPANCAVAVSATAGHWSDSYREDGLRVGTRIWAINQQPVARIQDAVALLNATLQADLAKLIQMGVATKVEVETVYKGSNKVAVSIIVTAPSLTNDETTITLVNEKTSAGWIWR